MRFLCCIERKIIMFLELLVMLLSAAQDSVSYLSCKNALLAPSHFCVHWDLQVLSCQASSQLADPQPLLVHGAVLPQLQTLHFLLLVFPRSLLVCFSSLLSHQSSGLSAPPPGVVSSAHTEGALYPIPRPLMKTLLTPVR